MENIDRSVRISPLDFGFVLEKNGLQHAVETWPNLMEKLKGFFGINGELEKMVVPLEARVSVDNAGQGHVEPVGPADDVGNGGYVFKEAPHFSSLGLPCQEVGVFQVVDNKDGVLRITRKRGGSARVWLRWEDIEYLKQHSRELDGATINLSEGKKSLLRSFIRNADLTKLLGDSLPAKQPSIDRDREGQNGIDLDADFRPILKTDTRAPSRDDDIGKVGATP